MTSPLHSTMMSDDTILHKKFWQLPPKFCRTCYFFNVGVHQSVAQRFYIISLIFPPNIPHSNTKPQNIHAFYCTIKSEESVSYSQLGLCAFFLEIRRTSFLICGVPHAPQKSYQSKISHQASVAWTFKILKVEN